MYTTLFLSMFYLSLFTFGGGYVIVGIMKKRFVEELKWIDETEMLDLIAIAQSAPGVLAVNASILVGYRIKGLIGALVASFATVLPPLIIITLISFIYNFIKTNIIIATLLKGMQIGVSAVVLCVVIQMLLQLKKERNMIGMILFVVAIILSLLLHVNTVYIIVLSLMVGIIFAIMEQKK